MDDQRYVVGGDEQGIRHHAVPPQAIPLSLPAGSAPPPPATPLSKPAPIAPPSPVHLSTSRNHRTKMVVASLAIGTAVLVLIAVAAVWATFRARPVPDATPAANRGPAALPAKEQANNKDGGSEQGEAAFRPREPDAPKDANDKSGQKVVQVRAASSAQTESGKDNGQSSPEPEWPKDGLLVMTSAGSSPCEYGKVLVFVRAGVSKDGIGLAAWLIPLTRDVINGPLEFSWQHYDLDEAALKGMEVALKEALDGSEKQSAKEVGKYMVAARNEGGRRVVTITGKDGIDRMLPTVEMDEDDVESLLKILTRTHAIHEWMRKKLPALRPAADKDLEPHTLRPATAPSGDETQDQYAHLRWGNPSGAKEDPGAKDSYLMKKQYYALSYNNTKGTPNWVSWRVVKEDLGGASREGLIFQPDGDLPPGFKKVVTGEYSGSGFDRGHMCPAVDRGADMETLKATFVMSNVVPQSPANNRKGWEQFESYCRSLAKEDKELYVVAGPQGQGGVGEKGPAGNIAGGKVVVPAKTWKVVMVLNRGGKPDPDTRLIAVIMPNDETVMEDWSRYRVSVRDVEQLTGYKFFDRADPAILDPLKEKVDRSPVPPPWGHNSSVWPTTATELKPLAAKVGASLKGRVTLKAKTPDLVSLTQQLQDAIKSKPDQMTACFDMAPDAEKSEQVWKIGKDNGVGNVVVWIQPPDGYYFQSEPATATWPAKVELSQPHCAFIPHLSWVVPTVLTDDPKNPVPSGQKFAVSNIAAVSHNTKWSGGDNEGELPPLAPNTPPKEVSLTGNNQIVHFQCNIHPWMDAWALVFNHPYAAVTDGDGRYTIKNVPVGSKIRVTAWHEKGPYSQFLTSSKVKGDEIEIKDGDNEHNFDFELKDQ